MASTRQNSRTPGKSSSLASPTAAKKSRIDSGFQASSNPKEVVDVIFSGKPADPDSDSSLLETVEVEEVDVTEEFVVSMDDNSVLLEDDQTLSQDIDQSQEAEATTIAANDELVSEEMPATEKSGPSFVFKDPNFIHSSKGPGGNKKTRIWKNLKQITTAERIMYKNKDCVTYGSVDAPPSFRPAKKYSDISGLEAKYTDPQTKLRYANAEEFQRVRMLPVDIVNGCLTLRKANTLVP